jgi:hypothetical protein
MISYLDMKLPNNETLPIESIKTGPFAVETDRDIIKSYFHRRKNISNKLSDSELKIRS